MFYIFTSVYFYTRYNTKLASFRTLFLIYYTFKFYVLYYYFTIFKV